MLEATYLVTIRNAGDERAMTPSDVRLAITNEAKATLAPEYLASLDVKVEADADVDIHELMARVREHPDFAFGTIFVPEDFPNDTVPDGFSSNLAADALAECGNEFIANYISFD